MKSFFRKGFLLIFNFFWKKKWIFPTINLLFVRVMFILTANIKKSVYTWQNISWKVITRNYNSKKVKRTFTLFFWWKQKKYGFCDNDDNCIHCKKLKYIRQCLGNAYYFSLRIGAPWQPTHWNVFWYHQIDKELENIQKPAFNFGLEIKYVRKIRTIIWHSNC